MQRAARPTSEIHPLTRTRCTCATACVVGHRLPARTTLPSSWLRSRRTDAITRHAQAGANLLRLTRAHRPGADHLLQRDDVGIDLAQHVDDA